jgi:methionyl aminopeptidase
MIRIKNKRQIAGIRDSGRVAASCLEHISQYVKAGSTTAEINVRVEEFIKKNKAVAATLGYHGYPASCCISVNEVVCHGIPGNYELKNGDIVNVDVTTILNGFYGDTSTMYLVGEVSKTASDLVKVAKDCLDAGIHEVRPGNYFSNIGYEINRIATSHGCGTVYQFCGHGVGLGFHEEPQIPFVAPKSVGLRMRPGMVFTIEPMINEGVADAIINEQDGWTATTADGKLSAQYEHTVVVTPQGFEVLTVC